MKRWVNALVGFGLVAQVSVWLNTAGGSGASRQVTLTARLPAAVLADLMNLAMRSSPQAK